MTFFFYLDDLSGTLDQTLRLKRFLLIVYRQAVTTAQTATPIKAIRRRPSVDQSTLMDLPSVCPSSARLSGKNGGKQQTSASLEIEKAASFSFGPLLDLAE